MKTTRMTMAGAMVKFLKNQYVKRDGIEHRLINGVFGIFGHGNVTGFGQALAEFGGKDLTYMQPKNEQAMVHTAIAYAKTKKRLGTFACTTSVGPGATNMVTGAATATTNRLPVLLLPGDIFANRLPGPVLQQLEWTQSQDVSVNDCFRPVSKYWDRINRPEQILTALPEAMRILADPAETGAVTVCMPEDVQAEAFDCPNHFLEKRIYTVYRQEAAREAVAAAAEMIRAAKKPMIIAGGGVHYSDACAALEKFAEATGIPVAVTQAGKGAVIDAHELCLGAVGVTGTACANEIALEADLVICLGTRLSDFTTASKTQFQNPNVKFIGVNVAALDAYKHGAHPLVGDARAVLGQLSDALKGHQISASYASVVKDAMERFGEQYREIVTPAKESQSGLMRQAEVIRVVNETIPKNSTILHAAGGLPGDMHKLWRTRTNTDYHSEYAYSCMGYEVAGALGVKLAEPAREVYAILGDGSYLMLNHELVTSVQEQKKITLILLDNHGYQCIHNLQKGCGGESFGNEFRYRDAERGRLEGKNVPVDFEANARSLGARTFVAKDEAGLKDALAKAKTEKNTCVILIEVDPYSSVPGYSWWDVPVAEVSGRKEVITARKNYEEKLQKQRLYY